LAARKAQEQVGNQMEPRQDTMQRPTSGMSDDGLAQLEARAGQLARERLERAGSLVPFALVGPGGTVLEAAEGTRGSTALEALYRQLGGLPPAQAVVVSEGSSDAHANLLVIYAEAAGGRAFRAVSVIRFARKTLWVGMFNLRKGRAELALLAREPVAARIWPG
jgi:hypothetical protein